MVETAVYLEDILLIVGWSRAKFFRKIHELTNAGVVFYRLEGRPPKKRICAFPSKLQRFIGLKASKGEFL